MTRAALGEFEQLVLLAILRLGERAYAPAILSELARRTGRPPSAGAIYVTLDRLETKGLLRARAGDSPASRGGRPRRYVAVTARGLRALRQARAELLGLWQGLEGVLDGG